jgi:hypothetical protein
MLGIHHHNIKTVSDVREFETVVLGGFSRHNMYIVYTIIQLYLECEYGSCRILRTSVYLFFYNLVFVKYKILLIRILSLV